MTAAAHRAAQFCVQALYGIGCVDHFPHLRGISKEGNNVGPVPAPKSRDRGKSRAPWPVLKGLQRRLGGLSVSGAVDGFELRGDRLAVFPGAEIQRIADQMYDTGLDLRLGNYRVDGFRKAL